MKNQIQAGVFKAHCLRILDDVKLKNKEYVITKRGTPYAKVVPVGKTEKKGLFGKMRGTISFSGDIINALDEKWDADS